MRFDQPCDSRSEVRARVVPELGDQWMLIQRTLDHRSLHTLAAPVNQAHFAESCLVCGTDVFLHNVHHITRREGVQVEEVFDRDLVHRLHIERSTSAPSTQHVHSASHARRTSDVGRTSHTARSTSNV